MRQRRITYGVLILRKWTNLWSDLTRGEYCAPRDVFRHAEALQVTLIHGAFISGDTGGTTIPRTEPLRPHRGTVSLLFAPLGENGTRSVHVMYAEIGIGRIRVL